MARLLQEPPANMRGALEAWAQAHQVAVG
jgi:hypothetical protein